MTENSTRVIEAIIESADLILSGRRGVQQLTHEKCTKIEENNKLVAKYGTPNEKRLYEQWLNLAIERARNMPVAQGVYVALRVNFLNHCFNEEQQFSPLSSAAVSRFLRC